MTRKEMPAKFRREFLHCIRYMRYPKFKVPLEQYILWKPKDCQLALVFGSVLRG
jgi:hypothetical protein